MANQIIFNNITEYSDAYTYIKPRIREKDSRKEIIALWDSFESYGMLQERVLKAKLTLKNLVYRD